MTRLVLIPSGLHPTPPEKATNLKTYLSSRYSCGDWLSVFPRGFGSEGAGAPVALPRGSWVVADEAQRPRGGTVTSIAMPLATTAVDLLHQPQLRWASRRMPATSESYWKCPACEAINTSASGHCSGCEARIDLNALEWVQHGRATTAAGRDGEGQGRPILVFVATALILAPFILSVWGEG